MSNQGRILGGGGESRVTGTPEISSIFYECLKYLFIFNTNINIFSQK
jgi:hypothetical protein